MLDHYEPFCSVHCTSQFVSDLQFPELAGGMANRSMQAPFSQGPAPHSPVGPPGLMAAGPMHDSSFMHPVVSAGGQFVPIPMQVSTFACTSPYLARLHALTFVLSSVLSSSLCMYDDQCPSTRSEVSVVGSLLSHFASLLCCSACVMLISMP